jgi:hypothetical protein
MGVAPLSKSTLLLSWACQIIAAVILGQTLFFKFTGAPESVYIFTTLGAEPWGRIGSGVMELVAVALLLYAKTPAIGAALALGLMAGAIGAHLTKLGIDVQGDGGTLFGLAVTTSICALVVILIRRRELPLVGHFF